jgi:hypothetical protein
LFCHQLGRAWASEHAETTAWLPQKSVSVHLSIVLNFFANIPYFHIQRVFLVFLAIETVSVRVFDVCGTKVMHPVNHFLDDFLNKEHKIVVNRNRVYIVYYADTLSGVFSVQPINQNPEGNTESQKMSKKTR